MSKKFGLIVLAVVLIGGGFYFFGGGNLQGRFGAPVSKDLTGSKILAGSSDSTSPVVAEVSAATNNDSLFLSKTDSKGHPNYSENTFASVDFTPVKKAGEFSSCNYSFGVDYKGTMLPTKSDSMGFLSTLYITPVQGGTTHSKTNSMAKNTNGTYAVSLPFSWGLSDASPVTLKISGLVDTASALSATAGDSSTYDANSFDLYLTGISCDIGDSSGNDYTWSATASSGANKYFKVPTSVSGKGLYLTHLTIGSY